MPLPGQPSVPGQPPAGAPAMLGAAPGGAAGAMTKPQGNQGNVAQAMSLVRNALEMFQKAIPMIPMGSPLHADLLKTVSNVSKHLESSEANRGVDLQTLLQMSKQASQQSPVQAANRMFPSPQSAPAMPTPTPPPAGAN